MFEVNGKAAWILDAKSPNEDIVKSKHVEQAYSYAIHSEVRVNFFALCNGKEFVLYDIQKPEPLLHFPLTSIPRFWEPLKSLLTPNKVFREDYSKLAKDLGLHLKRLGFESFRSLIFPAIPIMQITQLDPNQFSISGGLIVNDETNMVTFDFDENVFKQLKSIIPDDAFKMLSIRRKDERLSARFSDRDFLVTIDCKIGQNLEENEREIFLPMIVNRFIKINGSS
ncbi:restriction endonuclease [Tenacibaculum litopenaei]|uniref:restriction endonuclease n=1 Tax=Tenacibaculum litopenaei TaxID=396016 RepID=UPI0038B445B4